MNESRTHYEFGCSQKTPGHMPLGSFPDSEDSNKHCQRPAIERGLLPYTSCVTNTQLYMQIINSYLFILQYGM